jgi:hypothetical protein
MLSPLFYSLLWKFVLVALAFVLLYLFTEKRPPKNDSLIAVIFGLFAITLTVLGFYLVITFILSFTIG